MSAMLDEILEIPGVVRTTLAAGAPESEVIAAAIQRTRPRVVVIAARGTSDHAAVYARYLLESHLALPVVLAASSLTTVYRQSMGWSGALVIGISQSGQAPDVAAVLSAAREGGALTVAITNEAGSPVSREAEHTLLCRAGRERAVAATKTYVTELAVVASLVAALTGAGCGATTDPSSLARALAGVPAALERTLEAGLAWLERAGTLVDVMAAADRALVVSRGFNYATALEVALKLKETSGLSADGYSSADLLHGPIAIAGPRIPLLVIRPDGAMGVVIDGALDRLRAVGAHPWTIGGHDLAGQDRGPDTVAMPISLPEPLTPLAFVIPGQLVAEAVARRRGLDPDAPPHLTKVTRTL